MAKMERWLVQVLVPAGEEADDVIEELSLILDDETDMEVISAELDQDQTGVNEEE
jgi:hypothetical protein